MAKKILQIVDNAYRCTIEEQDDPIVWIAGSMKGSGADLALLLQGNAVNYAVKGQDASGLSFGGKAQKNPPAIDKDLLQVMGKGVDVFFVQDDAAERGLEASELIAGVKPVSRAGLAKLFAGYDQVWHW